MRLSIGALALGGALLLAGPDAAADGTDLDARLDLRQQLQDRRGAPPHPPASRQRAVGLLRGKLVTVDATLQTQIRPEFQHDFGGAGRVHLDEAYLRLAATRQLFVELGKRQIVNGVGLGFNPTDYWAEHKVIDRTVDDETRRAEREGDVVAGASYYAEGGSIQGYVAPQLPGRLQSAPTRYMLGITRTLTDLDADATLTAYGGDRPALGANLSATLGDALVAYTETSFRRGRDRAEVMVSGTGAGSAYGIGTDDEQVFVNALGGAQYTFGNGVNVNAEYFRNGEGYSGAEMDRISALRSAVLPRGRGAAALGALQARTRELLSSRNLRRNYAFLRVSNIALGPSTTLQLTTIRNLDDRSQFFRALATVTLTDQDLVQAFGDVFYGRRQSEYGMSAVAARILLLYRHHF